MIESRARFDWEGLVPVVLNPTKVSIIEAMLWIDRPLSASDLARVFDEKLGVSAVSYHLKSLRKWKVLKRVRKRQVRGAVESHYFFTKGTRR